MSTAKQREMIFVYWFRLLIGADISVDDISKIVLAFGNEYEMFVEELCHRKIKIENNGTLVYKVDDSRIQCNVFGFLTANPGRIYHWKLKVIERDDSNLNIGVIKADKCKDSLEVSWWNNSSGYSFYAYNGKIYNGYNGVQMCGSAYYANDIVEIWLDLKDGKKELWFGTNGKRHETKAIVKDSTDYKLAIGMCRAVKKVELLSFDIKH